MQLKRKRSESELSLSSSSTGSAFNSPSRPGCSSSHMDTENTSSSSPAHRFFMATPSHLPSRTMKRFRDNRPSQEEVHQRTINMLFSAAQRPQAEQDEPTPRPRAVHTQPPAPTPPARHHAQQASLHSFWKLPNSQSLSAATASVASPHVDASVYAPADCEDCGQRLRGDDGADGDVDMDIDGGSEAEAASCAGCGKHVCSHCSITNMGERRRCLGCADDTGKRLWIGSVGWTSKMSALGIF
ncbi:hypothetical protein BKA67DRAFT_689120 [Truncatella angustata]|uniref:Uncharacterized protein n=1 Tax=Truncatella angustata TaxID=152316 RepID=A0A9P8UTU8_9PEZI|nr:uncharacterized protein BKA67DRAFT_689120 [Truncatella angustata]KAH6657885.1 hypothetical protein BKA67DRAFT_689120 [Truncatella angustata]